jgi:hypothetical protein
MQKEERRKNRNISVGRKVHAAKNAFIRADKHKCSYRESCVHCSKKCTKTKGSVNIFMPRSPGSLLGKNG